MRDLQHWVLPSSIAILLILLMLGMMWEGRAPVRQSPNAQPSLEGAASPEECVRACARAWEARDWEAAGRLIAPVARREMVAVALIALCYPTDPRTPDDDPLPRWAKGVWRAHGIRPAPEVLRARINTALAALTPPTGPGHYGVSVRHLLPPKAWPALEGVDVARLFADLVRAGPADSLPSEPFPLDPATPLEIKSSGVVAWVKSRHELPPTADGQGTARASWDRLQRVHGRWFVTLTGEAR